MIFSDDNLHSIFSSITTELIKYYFNNIGIKINKLKQEKTLRTVIYENKDNSQESSYPFNYQSIIKMLKEKTAFYPIEFNLPRYECLWLDFSLDLTTNFHMHEDGKNSYILDKVSEQQFGSNFPISPQIDREGHIFTTFNPQLTKRIASKRRELVENSHKALLSDWVFDLRALILDTVSLLDITLHQIYVKAEYDPLPGWNFNKKKLGEKYGRRLDDKIKWIFQITGKNLNIESEKNSFTMIKNLRNHLSHFDPPVFAFTLEESVEWLNAIMDIGVILMKIRQNLGVNLSVPLIELLLQKKIKFNPEPAFKNRIPVRESGYSTCVWPS